MLLPCHLLLQLAVTLCFFGSIENTIQQDFFINLQLKHAVEIEAFGQQHVIKRHGLGNGAREIHRV